MLRWDSLCSKTYSSPCLCPSACMTCSCPIWDATMGKGWHAKIFGESAASREPNLTLQILQHIRQKWRAPLDAIFQPAWQSTPTQGCEEAQMIFSLKYGSLNAHLDLKYMQNSASFLLSMSLTQSQYCRTACLPFFLNWRRESKMHVRVRKTYAIFRGMLCCDSSIYLSAILNWCLSVSCPVLALKLRILRRFESFSSLWEYRGLEYNSIPWLSRGWKSSVAALSCMGVSLGTIFRGESSKSLWATSAEPPAICKAGLISCLHMLHCTADQQRKDPCPL